MLKGVPVEGEGGDIITVNGWMDIGDRRNEVD